MSDKQRLVLSIIDFLNQSIQDGTVKQDDQESLEVAIQCIGEAFGVDPSDEGQREKLSVKPATLQNIFDVFIKTRSKMSGAPATASTSEAQSSSTSTKKAPSAADTAAAEKLKSEGNAKMSAKDYDAAIELYTKAIALDPKAVYYSNRAAAYSSKGDHKSAVSDAEDALVADPTFTKAYHRLGHAHYCLGDYSSAADAFRRGLEMDPSNASLKSGLQSAQARLEEDDELPPLEPADVPPTTRSAPDVGAGAGAGAGAGLGGMADMLRNMGMGGGAGGSGGGMPDLAGLMNNPMMMQMAQQMMQNGGLERLMQNPNVANMMNRMQSGGGMPSMADLMADPELRNLASQFGAGAGQ